MELPGLNPLKGKGSEIPKLIEKEKSRFTGPEITGKKLGVIGLGAIGAMVANGAHSLGMDVTGYDPLFLLNAAWSLSRAVHRAESLESLLAESDYISIHIPLLPDTKDYINREAFSKMKKGVRLAELLPEANWLIQQIYLKLCRTVQ
jgi:D-3-phosphoglycerate dehydrogenase